MTTLATDTTLAGFTTTCGGFYCKFNGITIKLHISLQCNSI